MEHDEGNTADGLEIRRDLFAQVLEFVEVVVRVVRIPGGIGRIGLGQNSGDHARNRFRVRRVEPDVQIEGATGLSVKVVVARVAVIAVIVVPVIVVVLVAIVFPVILIAVVIVLVVTMVFIVVTVMMVPPRRRHLPEAACGRVRPPRRAPPPSRCRRG